MNRTLLLIIVDFLFLNLIALTRWEKAVPVPPQHPPVPAVAANAPNSATADQDLVATMRQALTDEQATREALAQKLAGTGQTLAAREQSLAAVMAEKGQLSTTLTETQRNAAELSREVAAAQQESNLSKEQLAQLQRDLAEKIAEANRQKQAIDGLEKDQANAKHQIEGLTMAVVVGEAEKQQLKAQTADLQTQVQAERAERAKVQESNTQLAQGVGQLAEKSADLTKEIHDNRPINANVLYSDFMNNRVETSFTATRHGLFGAVVKNKETPTVLITDGQRVYALLHLEDTVFSDTPPNHDWEKIGITFNHAPASPTSADSLLFLQADPRVVLVPMSSGQAAAMGVKVYPLAKDPFKFPDAVLIDGSKGYGEVGFKLDAAQPGYVRVDNRFFKRLFGDFAPSRGDLVFSHTGELLGIMVNSDYCAVIKDFTPAETIRTGDDTTSEKTGDLLDGIANRIRSMPLELQ